MRWKLFVAFIALACTPVFAQGPAAPAPGPEHKRLGFFVGTWTGTAQAEPNAFMPAGTYTSKDACEWFEGGFTVVCRSEGSGPMGPMKMLMILGYSTEEKVYTQYGVDSSPMMMTTVAKGKLDGKTWTYTDESKAGGKVIKSRYTLRETSPSSYTFIWEVQGQNGQWMTVMKGTNTKN